MIGVRTLDPAWCDDGFVSVAAADRMRTTPEHLRWLANVGVLQWRRDWASGDIEVEPAVVRP